jgi:dolichol-phosphate mannosyltransferase
MTSASHSISSNPKQAGLLSLIFSFRNEEEVLPELIQQTKVVLQKMCEQGIIGKYELVFVNDDSSDHSTQVIAQQAQNQQNGKIVLVNMSRRFGVEESFLAGINVAQGDVMVLMYTDMQDPPEVIEQMLMSWQQGAEVVHSIRRKRIGEHPLKNLAAFFAYRLIGYFAEIKIPYDAGEFKLISRNVAQHLLSFPEKEPYLRGLIPWIGFTQAYVEYEMQPRRRGKSKVALFGKKAWTVFLSGIISFSDFPVYLILLTGVMGIVLFVILLVASLWASPHHWIDPMVVGGVFLWGTLMSALGLIGLYVLKIYKNTRGRPQYIIKEVVRFDG